MPYEEFSDFIRGKIIKELSFTDSEIMIGITSSKKHMERIDGMPCLLERVISEVKAYIENKVHNNLNELADMSRLDALDVVITEVLKDSFYDHSERFIWMGMVKDAGELIKTWR